MKYLLAVIVLLSSVIVNGEMLIASSDSKLVVDSITKPHPRLWISNDRLGFLRKAYDNKTEPFYTALSKMISTANAGLLLPIEPYSGNRADQWRISANNDSKLAVCMAIAYHVTGKDKYKQKAIEIITARPINFPKPWKNVDENIGLHFPNRGLFIVCGTSGLILAYDLLADEPEFSRENKQAVDRWIRQLERMLKEDVTRWDTPYKHVSTKIDPRGWVETTDPKDKYFGSQNYQNHVGEHLMGLLEIGYVLGDRELVQYCLDSDDNPRDLKEMIDGAVHIAGDSDYVKFDLARVIEVGKIKGRDISVTDWYTLPPQTGEIYDRYRTIEGSGLGYSEHGFRMLLLCAELAYKNGIDFYRYTGKDGENLLLPFEFYKDFIITGDNTINGGYYVWSKLVPDFAEAYELGAVRYPEHKKMFAEVLQRQGYGRDDVSLYPVHRPNLSWLIAFGENDL